MKIKKPLKKFINKVVDVCINAVFEDEEEEREVLSEKESRTIYSDFYKRKMQIMEENSKFIITQVFMPEIQHRFFEKNDMLMSDEQAIELAIQKFIHFKKIGRIDNLNNLIAEQ